MLNRSDPSKHESNVVVENKQETVSCIFWPFHENFGRPSARPVGGSPKHGRDRSPKKDLNHYMGGLPKRKNSPLRQRLKKNFAGNNSERGVKTIKLDRDYDFDPN